MVLQKLIQLLLGHPQIGPRVINKLADSWPIRRAAKITAYFFLRGQEAVEQKVAPKIQEFSKIDSQRLKDTFKDELKKQWEEAQKRGPPKR